MTHEFSVVRAGQLHILRWDDDSAGDIADEIVRMHQRGEIELDDARWALWEIGRSVGAAAVAARQ